MNKSRSFNDPDFKSTMMEAALVKGPGFFEYQDYEIPLNNVMDQFEIIEKIGRGKYSDVFKAIRSDTTEQQQQFSVLKILKPIRMAKIKREIKILKSLHHESIINLEAVTYDACSKTFVLVFDYIEAKSSQYFELSDCEVRYYLKKMLEGLKYCHSQGIVHRDIKPQNVLIDRERRELKIIDWGLAEFYLPKKDYNVRVASRYYKGPELLLNNIYYDYSLDIWSVGCWLASLIFKKSVIFRGMDNVDQLFKIGEILGSDDIRRCIKKYGLKPDQKIVKWLNKEDYPKISFFKLQTKQNMEIANEKAIDLLQKMLKIDHNQRLTAAEALEHPYLQEIFPSS